MNSDDSTRKEITAGVGQDKEKCEAGTERVYMGLQ